MEDGLEPVAADEPLVEGRDDVANVRLPATRGSRSGGRNGVSRRNAHLQGFDTTINPSSRIGGARNNDPSSRFSAVTHGYESLSRMTDALTGYFAAAPTAPPRTLVEIGRGYAELSALANNSTGESSGAFYASLIQGLQDEASTLMNPD